LDGTPKPALNALTTTNTWLKTLQGTTTRTITVTPAADTIVRQQFPTQTGGASRLLRSDVQESSSAGSRTSTYLRFALPPLAAGESVAASNLTLHAEDATADGPQVWRTSSSWSESAMSWTRGQPRRTSTTPVGDFGEMPVGPVTVPLTGVSGGVVSLQLYATGPDGVGVTSREVATGSAPQLTVLIRR
ncbi:CBM96 family carbohydrate-binding protein, partial [Kineococcus sp. NUM-3379]